MANIEGTPDEVLESLFSMETTKSNTNNAAISTATSAGNNSSKRRAVVENRMEMAAGDRPAARVIRASPKVKTTTNSSTKAAACDSSQPPVVLGSIVERRTTQGRSEQTTGQPRKRQSQFLLQQQQRLENGASVTGLPSVNVPLRTFVGNKSKLAQIKETSQSVRITSAQQYAAGATTNSVSLRQASALDADAMLAQMSPEERLEKARELESALPPETIALFKKRTESIRKKANNKEGNNTSSAAGNKAVAMTTTKFTKDNGTIKAQPAEQVAGGDFLEEKQRIASVLSNIKSFHDLDAACQAEMGDDYSPLLQSSQISSEMAKQAQKDPFPLACTLLRSTLPRQTLWAVRVVSERLQQLWEKGKLSSLVPAAEKQQHPDQVAWPYPVLLPVSLRCLLDSSILHTNGRILHTYALQALYNLLRLRACVDHVVIVDNNFDYDAQEKKSVNPLWASLIYQEYFLEDAVPTPPVGNVYESIASVEAVSGSPASTTADAAVYKTSSSSKSAPTDGEAFAKDPLWTLLSRMCMIPRLAQLMKIAARTKQQQQLVVVPKVVVATCGILAMMAQRSPGAATAIVHHDTLLKDLLDVSVTPHDNSSPQPYDPALAIPAILLLCTLARQSRVAAERIPMLDDIIPPILARKPATALEHRLQRWCVVLWRTLLRYGLGLLPQIPIMIAIATPHMALTGTSSWAVEVTNSYSLTTEFASSFANILQCLQVGRRHLARVEASKEADVAISKDQFEDLSRADSWLSSLAQQIMTQLEKDQSATTTPDKDRSLSAEPMRFLSAQMQFLSAFLKASTEEIRLSTHSNGGYKDTESNIMSSESWIMSCQRVLAGYLACGMPEEAIGVIAPAAFRQSLSSSRDCCDNADLPLEASACAFVSCFVSLELCVVTKIMDRGSDSDSREIDDGPTKDSVFYVLRHFVTILANEVGKVTSGIPKQTAPTKYDSVASCRDYPLARRGWLNRACFACVELLTVANRSGVVSTTSGWAVPKLLQQLQFTLLGRLERGDEAMAAVVFSEDRSFQAGARKTARSSGEPNDSSSLSSMFFREMCRTSTARVQLDHSFKLRHGPGITPDEVGAFGLRSLLSGVDLPRQPGGSDFLLPMGILWLWQVLSSSVKLQTKEGFLLEEGENEMEVVQVVSSCLDLILELEEEAKSEGDSINCYASQVPVGAKAYHLVSICLQPEAILQSDLVTHPATRLLAIYSENMEESFGRQFARACVLHSDNSNKKAADTSKEKESEDEKFASQILDGPVMDCSGSFGEKEARAMMQLTGELCEAYIEYGAQYNFFTQGVRILSHSTFPSRIRSQCMRRLGQVLSLVTLPGEDDPGCAGYRERMVTVLTRSIIGSLPSYDRSARDPPDFLDSVASIYSKGGNCRIRFGYTFLYSVLVQSRHLAICAQPGAKGFEAAKKRIQGVNADFASVVMASTKRFLESADKSKKQLILSAIDAAVAWKRSDTPPATEGDVSQIFADLL